MGYIYTKSGKLAKRLYFGAVLLFEGLYYTFKNRVLADGGTFVENELPTISQDAKLVLTPNAYKAGKLYSAVPNDGTGDFTVDRNSTATYIGQDGLIKTALANVPRIENGAILIELQATNLYLNSDVLATQNITTTASSYTVSFYGTGTITFSGSYSGSLVGTGAKDRVSKTFTATAGTLTSTISGTVTEGQCEKGTEATSYIPTNGSTVTRLEDRIEVQDLVSKNLIKTTEGTLFFDLNQAEGVGNSIFVFRKLTNSETGALYYYGATFDFRYGTQFVYDRTKVFSSNSKVAIKYDNTGAKIFVNGIDCTKAGGTYDSTFYIEHLLSRKGLRGSISVDTIKVFNTALTNAQLIALTTP